METQVQIKANPGALIKNKSQGQAEFSGQPLFIKDSGYLADISPKAAPINAVNSNGLPVAAHSDHSPSRPGILSRSSGLELLRQGWLAADLHVHTFYSHDVAPTAEVDPLKLYQKAKARGLSFVSFTDHDTMEAYDRIGWTRDDVITGVEVKILDRQRIGHTIHVNVYSLNKKQFALIQQITRQAQNIELLTEYLKSENLPFVFNHPFWHEPGEKFSGEAVMEIVDLFPVLEYNMGRIRKLNRLMLQLAEAKNKGIVAGTDSHTGDIGRIFTLAPGNNPKEFFDSVKRGSSLLVTEDLNFFRIRQEILQRLEMLADTRKWVMGKKSLRLEAGHVLVDGIIQILTEGAGRRQGLKKCLVKFMARFLSHLGLPALIYLGNQRRLAGRLELELGV